MAIHSEPSIDGWGGDPYLGSSTVYKVPYTVYTDDRSQGQKAILASGCIPLRGDLHPDDSYCAAYSCDMKREKDNPLVWRVLITYKPDNIDQKEKDKNLYPNPLDRPIDIDWESVEYQKIVPASVEDYTPPGGVKIPAGTPILNSAGTPYDPTAEINDVRFNVSITKYVPAVPSWLRAMAGRVNSAPYTLDGEYIDTMSSRITRMRIGRFQRDNGIDYRELQMTIELREKRISRRSGDSIPEPYILELQDESYEWWDNGIGGSTGTGRIRVPHYKPPGTINETATDPVAPVPVLLNGFGMPLVSPDFNNTVFRPHCVYRTADFSVLPLT